jgi:hypothetical protein
MADRPSEARHAGLVSVGLQGQARRMRPGRLSFLVALAGAPACQGNPPPCFGINVGDKIAITVVDTLVVPADNIDSYDSGMSGICGFGLDLSQGSVLQATVTATVDDGSLGSCAVGVAQYQPFSGWTWTLSQNIAAAAFPYLLVGEYSATNGTCSGTVNVTLRDTEGVSPFDPSIPGQPPNVILNRSFSGGGPGCPTECQGDFVVNLQRQ